MAKKIMIIAEKETFLVRVLENKIKEADIEFVYSAPDVDSINRSWSDVEIVTFYMDHGERINENVIQFLHDRVRDQEKKMILIADAEDEKAVEKKFPKVFIYKVFLRPLDAEAYIETVKEVFFMLEIGGYKKSILIVDDDPSYLGLVREWLKDTYKVNMVSSGLQAIKWLGHNKADLILLDHEMPVTTGPQILEMLRSDNETRDIPVIFLTGKSDKESVMAVVALKPEGYFLKNIEKQQLLDKLEEFFALRK